MHDTVVDHHLTVELDMQCPLLLSVTLSLPAEGHQTPNWPTVGSNNQEQCHHMLRYSFLLQCKPFIINDKTHANKVVSLFVFC